MKKLIKTLAIIVGIILIFLAGSAFSRYWIINHESYNLRGGAITDMVELINAEREKEGVAPLTYSFQLSESAQLKCDDMIKNNYFAHYSPSGTSPWSFMAQAGYRYTFAGENISQAHGDFMSMDAFMLSPSHKANILSTKFTHVGIGRCYTYDYDIVVQHFGTPR
jgi:uncharacterized protein YkwD